MCVSGGRYRFQEAVADESAYGQSHEKVLERHDLFQINGKSCKENRITEGPQHRRKIEHFNIDMRRKPEIHYQLIDENRCETDGQQACVFEFHDLDPPEDKRASEQGADQLADRKAGRRHGPVAQHCRSERVLERFRSRAHDFEHEEEAEHRIKIPVLESGRVNERMTDIPHSRDAYCQCYRPCHADSAENIAVEPVVIFAVCENPDAFEQKQRPEYAAEPIDTDHRYLRHQADTPRQDVHCQCYN